MRRDGDGLPGSTRFETENGYRFAVISPEDIANADAVTRCSHGFASVQDCRQCGPAGMFHRQILRMVQWMARQEGRPLEPGLDRQLADEYTREQCGFLPEIGAAPAEQDLPPLPPIKLSRVGLVARAAAVEGSQPGEVSIEIAAASGQPLNELQRALLDSIADGASWEP